MKSKIQKQNELKKSREMAKTSPFLVVVDISKIGNKYLELLRRELKKANANMIVLKKRLLNILTKEYGFEFNFDDLKAPIASVFGKDIETISGLTYKFLKSLEKEKIADAGKMLVGFDFKDKKVLDKNSIQLIGSLPPKEVLISQVVWSIASPFSSLLFILNEQSKKVGK
jgi:ribosomal protein L10